MVFSWPSRLIAQRLYEAVDERAVVQTHFTRPASCHDDIGRQCQAARVEVRPAFRVVGRRPVPKPTGGITVGHWRPLPVKYGTLAVNSMTTENIP